MGGGNLVFAGIIIRCTHAPSAVIAFGGESTRHCIYFLQRYHGYKTSNRSKITEKIYSYQISTVKKCLFLNFIQPYYVNPPLFASNLAKKGLCVAVKNLWRKDNAHLYEIFAGEAGCLSDINSRKLVVR